MPRTGQDALDWCANQVDEPSRNWTGLCLVFARSAFGVAAKYGDAATAWRNSALQHSTAGTPPAAVPVWWTGGSHGHGHVAVSTGDGSCYSSDILRQGKIDLVRIALISQRWGLPYRGWTEDINDVRVFTAPDPTPSPPAGLETFQLFLDGRYVTDMPVIGGTSYCPVRAWGAALGFRVTWDPADNTVSFDGDKIGSPLRMIGDSGYLPIRLLVQEAGLPDPTLNGIRVNVTTPDGTP